MKFGPAVLKAIDVGPGIDPLNIEAPLAFAKVPLIS
jgi:hypothetical protein